MKKLDVINFLRGYSIFTIVLMHLVQSYSLPSWAMKATSFGGAGVHVFILCSGFGLYLSYLNKPLGYKADGCCVYSHRLMDAISRERGIDALVGQLVPFQNVCSGVGEFHGRADVVHIHHHPILHRMAFDCKVNKY